MPKPAKKTILITAGPTVEPLDPVRYLSNYSTGVMGFELAKAAKSKNYRVVLISGPTVLARPKGVKVISVKTAIDMRREVLKFFRYADFVVMAAAVSDFRPAAVSIGKIKKKSKGALTLKLVRNPDILQEIGRIKGNKVLVGYSLETGPSFKSAKEKLKSKNLDLIVVNNISKNRSPFGTGSKDIAIIDREGNINALRGLSKEKIAVRILDKIEEIKTAVNGCFGPAKA